MFGLTRYVPITTSLTALSVASFAGFGQLAHADRNNRLYQGQGASRRNVNQWQANSDVWDDGDDLKIASGQRKPDNLSAYSIPNDNNKRATQSDTDFPAVVELSSLDGHNGFQINGLSEFDRSGCSVSNAGDVNGDGYADIIIGAYNAAPHGKDWAGESYVVFGKESGFGTVELSSLDGFNGFQINGISESRSGRSVSNAGDVNGDGYTDIIIGAYAAAPHGKDWAGESYVVFGKESGFETVELSSLDGVNGFQINGISAFDYSSFSVNSAGDVNGDGYADIIVGAPYYVDPHGGQDWAGESYVVFGKESGFGTVELSSLDGVNGFQVNGIADGDHSGWSVSGAGDVNGDGYDDIIVGAPYANLPGKSSTGESYVVFGKESGFGTVELSSLDGVNGFQINGIASGNRSGRSVSGAGDVNGDGYTDIIIGAYAAAPHGANNAGESYVVFGKESGFETVELSSLDGVNGFQINGIASGNRSGHSVSGAGDVNGDGYTDIIIGAYAAAPHGANNAGESYVVFGKASGFETIELSSLDGFNGFQINGIASGDYSGYSVSGAGDVNGDGYTDIIIGAYLASPYGASKAGESYVIFGVPTSVPTPSPTPSPTPTSIPFYPGSISVSDLNGQTGSILTGANNQALMGGSVSHAGDVNDDGIADVIVGAKGTVVESVFDAGAGYVVFGDRSGFPGNVSVTKLTGENGFSLIGGSGREFATSVSGAGDVNDDGVADVIIGSPYDVDGVYNTQTGQAYVVYGSRNNFPQTVNVTQLDGKNGFTLVGESCSDRLGNVVSAAGDINRDGRADFMVSAPYASVDGQIQAGKAYVVFGNYQDTPSVFNVTVLDGTNGFSITGETAFDHLGQSLSWVGDVNGDGVADIGIGAPEALVDGKTQAGKVYVLFGSRNGFPSSIAVKALNGTNGFCINGAEPFDNLGASISWSELNDDRLSDIIIGAPNAQNSVGMSSGRVYVFFGRSAGFLPQYNVSNLTPEEGFILDGEQASDRVGSSVAGIGDFSADGVNDMLVGAPQATANGQPRAGKGYVVFGQRGGYPSTIALSSLDGNNGFTIEGEKFGDNLGSSVSGAGDINQDGVPDILLGAPGTDNGGTGYTALVYGGVSLFSDARQGQSLRSHNNNTPNLSLTAAKDVAPVVADVPALV